MLVSSNIVNRWYQKDHWIYKQFSFLFNNPLYQKKIPGGFSVCPYFWLSLFSFFIGRPTIYLLLLGKWVLSLLWSLIKPVSRIFNIPAIYVANALGCGLIGFLLYRGVSDMYMYWGPIIASAFFIGFPLTIASVVYFGINKNKN